MGIVVVVVAFAVGDAVAGRVAVAVRAEHAVVAAVAGAVGVVAAWLR